MECQSNLALAKPLSARELARRDQLEAVIRSGKKAFHAVALAILEIRDNRLYRSTHRTFAEYCTAKFQFSRSHGYRLIQVAGVIQKCELNGCPSPTSQRKAIAIAAQHVLADQRPAVTKTAAIQKLVGKLRKLHVTHPWRTRADELLTLYCQTVLPWPAEG